MTARNSRQSLTVFILAVTLGLTGSGIAQVTTGTVTGLVADPAGAVVPNATVIVEEQNTGVSIETRTGTSGHYTVPLLKPGTYSITVGAPGFASAERTDLTLEIQQTVEVDFRLEVGQVTQKVKVVGSGAPLIQTASSELGDVITQQTTEQLPLNGRNFSQLALLVPGPTLDR